MIFLSESYSNIGQKIFCPESDLRDGCVDSFDILQHDDLFLLGDARLYGFSQF